MMTAPSFSEYLRGLGFQARKASYILAQSSEKQRNQALMAAAASLRNQSQAIKLANEKDMGAGREKGLSSSMLDRLMLDDKRIESMAKGLEDIATLPNPLGRILAQWDRPNGLHIQRIAVPLGVIGIIYESRPNVTADAAGLCIKSGNAAILRGGSESFNSSHAIMNSITQGIIDAGLPLESVQMIKTTDRAAVGEMLQMVDYIDVIVPRGGKGLVARIKEESKVPLFQHLEGICHLYVDHTADLTMASDVVFNAKMRRTGICGAAETLLVEEQAKESHLPHLVKRLLDAGCEIRGDQQVQKLDSRIIAANELDWSTEYLDSILSVKLVKNVDEAISHINKYGSRHTESILTSDEKTAETFMNGCDSAILLWNASTQFADGGEFGMGAEIGISTGKMHARGPVGIEQLCTFKYKVMGNGQIRAV